MAGELESAGKGAISGALTGAKLGSLVPGVGNAVGAGVGALVGGIGSGIKANRASQADQSVQAQDPQELARLAEIDRIRKSIGAGTDPLTQQKLQEAQQIGASTQANIARATGGNVGATIAGLTRAQRGTQAASNQAIAGAQQRLPFFENLGQNLRTRVSQRALELGLQRRDQAMAEKAAAGKAASANLSGAIASLANNQQLPTQSPAGAGGGFVANQTDQVGLDQSGLQAKSTLDVGGDVSGIDTQQSPSLAPNFSGGSLLPQGFGAGAQTPMNIADQGLNSPVQQVPLVAPGAQSSILNTITTGGSDILSNLANSIRSNPTGDAPGILGAVNQLKQ